MNTAVHLVKEKISADANDTIVIIGTGPVGIKALTTLLERSPQQNIVIYGDEPWEPYNRVRLSSFLAGEIGWSDITESQKIPQRENLVQHHHCKVVEINRQQAYVVDELGRIQHYSKLILALGSHPHIPSIEGIELQRVYTFRNMSDTQHLLARRVKSRTVAVIGGGVLGLEVAKAMTRNHTKVIVVDHAQHLMLRQLDEQAATLLNQHISDLGIQLYLGNGIKRIIGKDTVSAIELRNGEVLSCDTVIFSTGIKPNIQLAREAKLSVGRGIRVSDTMQTSDPNIYAVGECAEHRETVYGLVAPGYEQAKVAIADIEKRTTQYTGSITATQLKVVGLPVFSMGRTGEGESKSTFNEYIYQDTQTGVYRKIIRFRNRLVGAIAIGEWGALARIQEGIVKQRYIWPWQIRRFIKTGDLWPLEQGKSVSQWPASAVVCNCTGVTRGQCSQAISSGCNSIESVMQRTSASTVCGSCRPLIQSLLGGVVKADKIPALKSFLLYSVLISLMVTAAVLLPGIAYNASSMTSIQWDLLWRDNLIKQISGYSILFLIVVGLLLSLRKRWPKFALFDFTFWRYLHVLLGVFIGVGLFLHTGFRLGDNLNAWLMLLFLGLMLIGSMFGVFMSLQHKIDGVLAQRIRGYMQWGHVLLFWPLPALLTFHIIKTYYF